jgi:hypothetical protein
VPKWLKVEQFGNRPGWGEDDLVYFARLEPDGWELVEAPTKTKDDFGGRVWIEFSPPLRWRKRNPKWPKRHSLEMSIIGIQEKDGPWYLVEHAVTRRHDQTDNIGRSDWADWSRSGDLLFGMDGCFYRAPCKEGVLVALHDAAKIGDFSQLHFEPIQASSEFRRWPSRYKAKPTPSRKSNRARGVQSGD